MESQLIDYSEHFDTAEALSWHLIQDYAEQVQKEANMMVRSGKATMSCDLSKRDKHG